MISFKFFLVKYHLINNILCRYIIYADGQPPHAIRPAQHALGRGQREQRRTSDAPKAVSRSTIVAPAFS